MSTVQSTIDPDDSDECPHGVEGVEETPMRCWFCLRESETGRMVSNDPRRDDDE